MLELSSLVEHAQHSRLSGGVNFLPARRSNCMHAKLLDQSPKLGTYIDGLLFSTGLFRLEIHHQWRLPESAYETPIPATLSRLIQSIAYGFVRTRWSDTRGYSRSIFLITEESWAFHQMSILSIPLDTISDPFLFQQMPETALPCPYKVRTTVLDTASTTRHSPLEHPTAK